MIDDKKSTDPGLSAAERKTLRGHEAQEPIADHESAQKAFHENRERLREERMVREAAEGPMVPVPAENQIRTYWWCSPPRIWRQRICPARSMARENGASFSKDECVRISLYNTTTERPRDRGVRASLSVASLGR